MWYILKIAKSPVSWGVQSIVFLIYITILSKNYVLKIQSNLDKAWWCTFIKETFLIFF
jgi:hypothetical protein